MNFHKTIGYLAALLLMVGLGVPDSFAQTISVEVVSVTPATVRDDADGNRDHVTVTVTGDMTEMRLLLLLPRQ